MAQVDVQLSDRARGILRRADTSDDLHETLELVQQAIDETRDHLASLSEMLDDIAAEIARRRA